MTTATKERPILFTPAMAQAIAEGRKTQTRRVVKLRDKTGTYSAFGDDGWPESMDEYGDWHKDRCPYGVPGDRLWVREKWRPFWHPDLWCSIQYAADSSYRKPEFAEESRGHRFADLCELSGDNAEPWHSPIHMWREMSRIALEIVSVRVERVESITIEDAIAEGGLYMPNRPTYEAECAEAFARGELKPPIGDNPRERFLRLFYDINKRAPEGSNPWVWVVEFRKVDP